MTWEREFNPMTAILTLSLSLSLADPTANLSRCSEMRWSDWHLRTDAIYDPLYDRKNTPTQVVKERLLLQPEFAGTDACFPNIRRIHDSTGFIMRWAVFVSGSDSYIARKRDPSLCQHRTVSRGDTHSTPKSLEKTKQSVTHNQTSVWKDQHPPLQVHRGIKFLVLGIRMVKTLKFKPVDLITSSASGPRTWDAAER